MRYNFLTNEEQAMMVKLILMNEQCSIPSGLLCRHGVRKMPKPLAVNTAVPYD